MGYIDDLRKEIDGISVRIDALRILRDAYKSYNENLKVGLEYAQREWRLKKDHLDSILYRARNKPGDNKIPSNEITSLTSKIRESERRKDWISMFFLCSPGWSFSRGYVESDRFKWKVRFVENPPPWCTDRLTELKFKYSAEDGLWCRKNSEKCDGNFIESLRRALE